MVWNSSISLWIWVSPFFRIYKAKAIVAQGFPRLSSCDVEKYKASEQNICRERPSGEWRSRYHFDVPARNAHNLAAFRRAERQGDDGAAAALRAFPTTLIYNTAKKRGNSNLFMKRVDKGVDTNITRHWTLWLSLTVIPGIDPESHNEAVFEIADQVRNDEMPLNQRLLMCASHELIFCADVHRSL